MKAKVELRRRIDEARGKFDQLRFAMDRASALMAEMSAMKAAAAPPAAAGPVAEKEKRQKRTRRNESVTGATALAAGSGPGSVVNVPVAPLSEEERALQDALRREAENKVCYTIHYAQFAGVYVVPKTTFEH